MAIGIEFSLFMWPSSGFLHISRGAASPLFVPGLVLPLSSILAADPVVPPHSTVTLWPALL